ncbi:PREDICTED: uncharacterized protein LOC109128697 [Camelina sativa]|uniref:S-protein homolog n=1 Tax=Camelina sativa TaxID=90675 RepID=A0ABM1QWE8_CAMSA|nr:PREDICTED: uncharacterized protein LOC109128697 [Camelina sativa]
MASTNNHPFLSSAAAEVPGNNGLMPLARKHVVIRYVVDNFKFLNVRCKSNENDLGRIRLAYLQSWGFRFHVNISKSTKFHCHFWWKGEVRKSEPKYFSLICQQCIWEVGYYNEHTICRINRDRSLPYCFLMDDHP